MPVRAKILQDDSSREKRSLSDSVTIIKRPFFLRNQSLSNSEKMVDASPSEHR